MPLRLPPTHPRTYLRPLPQAPHQVPLRQSPSLETAHVRSQAASAQDVSRSCAHLWGHLRQGIDSRGEGAVCAQSRFNVFLLPPPSEGYAPHAAAPCWRPQRRNRGTASCFVGGSLVRIQATPRRAEYVRQQCHPRRTRPPKCRQACVFKSNMLSPKYGMPQQPQEGNGLGQNQGSGAPGGGGVTAAFCPQTHTYQDADGFQTQP